MRHARAFLRSLPILLLFPFLWPWPSEAVRSLSPIRDESPITNGWLFGGADDFVVAQVVSVNDSKATNTNPPRVSIRVLERLRGSLEPGIHVVEWTPAPLTMLCGVGEENTIRAWENEPLKGPSIGSRYILGGMRNEGGVWQSDFYVRWALSDSVYDWVRHELPQYQIAYRASLRSAQIEAHEREKAEQARAAGEREKLAAERTFRSQADIDDLVRSSDAIALGELPIPTAVHSPGWGQYALFQTRRWFVVPDYRETRTDGVLAVVFGTREGSLYRRWIEIPKDDAPGSPQGKPIRCIAFLRFISDPIKTLGPDPLFRPSDPVAGILLADSTLIRMVAIAVEKRAGEATESQPACASKLSEFEVRDSAEAAEVALKISPLRGTPDERSLVLSCPPLPSGNAAINRDAGWFIPCAVADVLYNSDISRSYSFSVPAAEMKVFVDSLLATSVFRTHRVDATDPFALCLRRVVQGRERFYEVTLSREAAVALSKMMESVFFVSRDFRFGVEIFWNAYDRQLGTYWEEGTNRRLRTRG